MTNILQNYAKSCYKQFLRSEVFGNPLLLIDTYTDKFISLSNNYTNFIISNVRTAHSFDMNSKDNKILNF